MSTAKIYTTASKPIEVEQASLEGSAADRVLDHVLALLKLTHTLVAKIASNLRSLFRQQTTVESLQ